MRPEQVGLEPGSRRRVAGLRREEVATLARIGITWYTMLESGADVNVSAQTLEAIGRALLLTESELAYVRQLALDESAAAPDERADPLAVRTIDALGFPAYVCTSQWNVLAWNAAFAFVWGIEAPGGAPFNIVRRMWSPEIRALHGEGFEPFARRLVAMIRAGTARRFDDPAYRQMFAELRHDDVFAAAWDAYDVAAPLGLGRTTIESPACGTFTYDALTLPLPQAVEQSIVVHVPNAESASRLWAMSSRVK